MGQARLASLRRIALAILVVGLRPSGARAEGPSSRPAAPGGAEATDANSLGNPDRVRVRHLALDLSVDFARKRLAGTASLDIERRPSCPAATPLVLDTRDLAIDAVSAEADDGTF